MVGKNVLKLNQATIRDALQDYLGERYEVGPDEELVVEMVTRSTPTSGGGYDATGGDFDVTVNIAKKEAPKPAAAG